MVVENVRGAEKWVGGARWHYGSYYLWGDVPAIMPFTGSAQKVNPDGTNHGQGSWFKIADSVNRGVKVRSENGRAIDPGKGARFTSRDCGIERKNGGDWFGSGKDFSLQRRQSSKSPQRKAASAQIAEI